MLYNPHTKLNESLRKFVSLALFATSAVLSTVRIIDVSSTQATQEARVLYENYLIADVQVTHFIKIDEVGFSTYQVYGLNRRMTSWNTSKRWQVVKRKFGR